MTVALQRIATRREFLRFNRMIKAVSDRYGVQAATRWSRAVLAYQGSIDQARLATAIASGNLQSIEAVVQASRLQMNVERALRTPFTAAVQAAGTRGQAMLTSAGINATFNATHPNVVLFARTQAATLVRAIPEQTRTIIREVIAAGAQHGLTIEQQARALREVVGLPPNWANAPQALRRDILNGNVSAATSRRLSATDRQQIRSRIANGTADQAFADAMAETYAARLVQRRALNIARTESIRAAHAGLQESWEQASQQGALPNTARRFWLVTPDAHLSPEHARIPSMNPSGRGLKEAFITPEGPHMYPPSRPNCRCSIAMAFPPPGTTVIPEQPVPPRPPPTSRRPPRGRRPPPPTTRPLPPPPQPLPPPPQPLPPPQPRPPRVRRTRPRPPPPQPPPPPPPPPPPQPPPPQPRPPRVRRARRPRSTTTPPPDAQVVPTQPARRVDAQAVKDRLERKEVQLRRLRGRLNERRNHWTRVEDDLYARFKAARGTAAELELHQELLRASGQARKYLRRLQSLGDRLRSAQLQAISPRLGLNKYLKQDWTRLQLGVNPATRMNPVHLKRLQRGMDEVRSMLHPDFFKMDKRKVFRFLATNEDRSFARYYTADISLTRTADLKTLAHEFGHIMEARHPGVHKAAIDWMESRGWRATRAGAQDMNAARSAKLGRSITHHQAYEVTHPDDFFDPYIGVIYGPDGLAHLPATETVAMGMGEIFMDPLGFANKDFGHFELILRILHGEFL